MERHEQAANSQQASNMVDGGRLDWTQKELRLSLTGTAHDTRTPAACLLTLNALGLFGLLDNGPDHWASRPQPQSAGHKCTCTDVHIQPLLALFFLPLIRIVTVHNHRHRWLWASGRTSQVHDVENEEQHSLSLAKKLYTNFFREKVSVLYFAIKRSKFSQFMVPVYLILCPLTSINT